MQDVRTWVKRNAPMPNSTSKGIKKGHKSRWFSRSYIV
jgi:hypothetical protein